MRDIKKLVKQGEDFVYSNIEEHFLNFDEITQLLDNFDVKKLSVPDNIYFMIRNAYYMGIGVGRGNAARIETIEEVKKMKVLSFVNQKGGVAKSTSAVNVGAGLADQGRRVLLVDLDPQGALSICSGYREIAADDLTTYDVLKGAEITKALQPVSDNLTILPTDIRLSGAEIELSSVTGREFLLKEALETVGESFDYVLIDCPPSLGILTLIALTASDGVIIPVKADYLGLNGMSQLLDVIRIVRKRINPELSIDGVILTFFDQRRTSDQQAEEQIEKYFPGKLFDTKIPQNTALGQAPSKGTNIFEYNPKSTGAKKYAALTEEIIKREEN